MSGVCKTVEEQIINLKNYLKSKKKKSVWRFKKQSNPFKKKTWKMLKTKQSFKDQFMVHEIY